MRKVIVALLLFIAPAVFAHGGGLNKDGCHTNRKTGDYHCHGGPTAAPAPETAAPSRGASSSAVPRTQLASIVTAQNHPTNAERDLVRAAQLLLNALAYQPSLLGSLDARTKAAVQAFQRTERLNADGAVSEFLVLRLAEKIAEKCR